MFEHSRHPFIDLKSKAGLDGLMRAVIVDPGEPFILQPRDFVLAITEETLELDAEVLGRLEGRSSLGRIGIIVHGTAGLFDPGWSGKATLELSNLSRMPVALYAGMRICSFTFEQLSSPVSVPYSKKLHTSIRGRHSPWRAGSTAKWARSKTPMGNEALVIALFAYIVFLFSTVCHEASHALAAKLGGDLTAYHGGQVDLNPVPHIRREPFGLGLFPIATLLLSLKTGGVNVFGFASAPFDVRWAIQYPRRAAWMALAGPAANFAIALLAGISIRTGIALGLFTSHGRLPYWQVVGPLSNGFAEPLSILLSLFFYMNLLLGLFNLFPIPPLDGFSMLLFVVPQRHAVETLPVPSEIRDDVRAFDVRRLEPVLGILRPGIYRLVRCCGATLMPRVSDNESHGSGRQA